MRSQSLEHFVPPVSEAESPPYSVSTSDFGCSMHSVSVPEAESIEVSLMRQKHTVQSNFCFRNTEYSISASKQEP